MRKKYYQDELDNKDRWLISYADLITLLLALFVVLYAMSASVGNSELEVLSNSLGQVMGKQPKETRTGTLSNTPSTSPIGILPPLLSEVVVLENPMTFVVTPELLQLSAFDESGADKHAIVSEEAVQLHNKLQRERTELTGIAKELQGRLASLVDQGKIRVTQSDWGVSVEINASILFARAEAKLNEDAIQTLKSIADVLKDQPQLIHVEGHTDNIAISTPQYPSNWELSSARAGSVVRLFIESGIQPQRLMAIGHADNHPVASNDTAEGRLRNRRVQLMILSGSLTANQAATVHQ